MSSGSSQRRKEPLFQQVQEKQLPKHPRPIETKLVDPFEDLPAVGPRSARRTMPDWRAPEPEPEPEQALPKPPVAPAQPEATAPRQAAAPQPAAPTEPRPAAPRQESAKPPAASAAPKPSAPRQESVAKKAQFPYPEHYQQPAAKAKSGFPYPEQSTQTVAKKVQFPHPEDSEQPAAKTNPALPRPEPLARSRDDRTPYDRPVYDRPTFNRQIHYDEPQQYWDAPITLVRQRPGLLLLLAFVVCGAIVWWWASARPETFLSAYNGGHMPAPENAASAIVIPANTPPGQHSVLGQPSISAADIDTVLSEYGSPAAGTGQAWVAIGERYGIDPAYALAFFIHESSAGTNPGWAGLKSDGGSTHNVGNIICAGYSTCYGRFRDYPGWEEGIDDWYKLIGNEYVNGRSASTVEQIIPIYAPSSDNNDVPAYVQSVVGMVDNWRRGVLR